MLDLFQPSGITTGFPSTIAAFAAGFILLIIHVQFKLNITVTKRRSGRTLVTVRNSNIWRKTGNSIQKSTGISSIAKKLVSQRWRTVWTTEHCGREEVFPRHIKQIVDLNLGSKTKHPNMCFVVSLRLFSQVPRYYLSNPFYSFNYYLLYYSMPIIWATETTIK
jgi:hypothetical protein